EAGRGPATGMHARRSADAAGDRRPARAGRPQARRLRSVPGVLWGARRAARRRPLLSRRGAVRDSQGPLEGALQVAARLRRPQTPHARSAALVPPGARSVRAVRPGEGAAGSGRRAQKAPLGARGWRSTGREPVGKAGLTGEKNRNKARNFTPPIGFFAIAGG